MLELLFLSIFRPSLIENYPRRNLCDLLKKCVHIQKKNCSTRAHVFSLKVQLESLYRSYYAQVGLPPGPRLVPPMKRPRIHGPVTSRATVKPPSPNKSTHPNNNIISQNITTSSTINNPTLTDLKTYSKCPHFFYTSCVHNYFMTTTCLFLYHITEQNLSGVI